MNPLFWECADLKISVAYYSTTNPKTQDFLLRLQEEMLISIGFLLQLTEMIFTPVIEIVFCEFLGENILDKSRLGCLWNWIPRKARPHGITSDKGR